MITRIGIAAAVLLFVAGPPCEPQSLEGTGYPDLPSIVLVGDVLLAGQAERLIEQEGAAAPFAGVRDVLRDADLAIGNLECALGTCGQPAEKQYTFRANPGTAAALAEAGFDLVTLANNHTVDYGPEALLETLSALRERGIRSVGAGENIEEARRWVLVERGSPPVRIAVLAFSNMLPEDFYAGPDRPGTNRARPEVVASDVAAARGEADVVIVSFHWGPELSSSPSPVQRRLAAAAAEAGADLVVGHHPHVLQGLEARGHALIAYSLGNFLFPSRGDTRRTMILRYTPAPDGTARAQVIPCVIDGFRPRLAAEGERSEILTYMVDLSRLLGGSLSPMDGSIMLPPRSSAEAESGTGTGRSAAGPCPVDKGECGP